MLLLYLFINIDVSDGGVTPGCVTACDSSPCRHGSQCVSAGRHDYQCICQNPLVQLGKNCEKGWFVILASTEIYEPYA